MAIPVSPEWLANIGAQFRFPAHMRVLLTVVPPGMRESAVFSSDDTEDISNIDVIGDGVSDYCLPVATFEENRWAGTGLMYLPSDDPSENRRIEWWSNRVELPVELYIRFDQPYSIPGIYGVWDTETNSWPAHLDVIGYNYADVEVARYQIKNIVAVEQYSPCEFDDIQSMRVRIHEWSRTNWRARINEIVFGLYLRFSNNEILNSTFESESSLLSEDLPQFNVEFTIKNYDKAFDPTLQSGFSPYLVARQQVKLQWGFEATRGVVEWLPEWPMYLHEWQIPSDSPEVTMSATSRITFIDKEYSKGLYDGQLHNMYDLAEQVLLNSGIIQEYDGEHPWELPESLTTFSSRAPVPLVASNAALQRSATATGPLYDTDPLTGYVRIRESVQPTTRVVNKNQQLGDPAFSVQDRLKSVTIGVHSFYPEVDPKQVYELSIHLAGTVTLVAKYTSDAIVVAPSVNITGATLISATYYARSAVLKVVAPVAGADVYVEITGTAILEATTFVKTYDDYNVPNGLEIEVDNPFITESSNVQALTDDLVSYYLRRNHLKVPYLGYPELEVGDTVNLDNSYGNTEGDIVGLSLKFNGGYSGTIAAIAKEASDDVADT